MQPLLMAAAAASRAAWARHQAATRAHSSAGGSARAGRRRARPHTQRGRSRGCRGPAATARLVARRAKTPSGRRGGPRAPRCTASRRCRARRPWRLLRSRARPSRSRRLPAARSRDRRPHRQGCTSGARPRRARSSTARSRSTWRLPRRRNARQRRRLRYHNKITPNCTSLLAQTTPLDAAWYRSGRSEAAPPRWRARSRWAPPPRTSKRAPSALARQCTLSGAKMTEVLFQGMPVKAARHWHARARPPIRAIRAARSRGRSAWTGRASRRWHGANRRRGGRRARRPGPRSETAFLRAEGAEPLRMRKAEAHTTTAVCLKTAVQCQRCARGQGHRRAVCSVP